MERNPLNSLKLLASNDPHPAKNTSSSWPSRSSSLVIIIDSFSDITIDTWLKFLLTCSLTCLLTSNWRFYWHSYWHLHWHFVDIFYWRSHWHLLLACSLAFSCALTLTFCCHSHLIDIFIEIPIHRFTYIYYAQMLKAKRKLKKHCIFSSTSLNKCILLWESLCEHAENAKTLKNHYVFHQNRWKSATFNENPCAKMQKTQKR